MEKILLANIGNRNITYKGLSYPDQKANFPGTNFRFFTESLLLNFDEEKKHIQPAILPALFDSLDMLSIKKLVIFYSDIQGGDRNDQDTIYEAKILEKIFSQQFPHLQIVCKAIHCSVVDNNGLMKAYRNHLVELLETHAEENFIICDAGGTAQQKSALKILVEFLFPKDQFETYNVLQKGNISVQKISSEEYRKVINQEQIRSLIYKYNYEAALEIYGFHAEENDILQSFVNVSRLLFANEVKAAIAQAQLPIARVHPDMTAIKMKGNYFSEWVNWQKLLKKESHFKLCLFLDIAACYQKRNDKGFTILYHHIFFERFLSDIINPYLEGRMIENRGSWEWIKERLITKEIFPEFIPPDGKTIYELYSASLPVQKSIALSIKDERIDTILTAMEPLLQTTFSELRNKFAHEGKSISNDNITAFTPAFNKWRKAFELPDTDTLFDKLNKSILIMLK